jgi:glycosyltransferase involved in cell wall biosynthesis
VVVIPSQLESFPLVLWEAMGIGCPIITSDLDFAREACGDAAVYCDPLSGSAFGDAMLTILQTRSHAEELSAAAKARFECRHKDWDAIGREYVAAIEAL